MEEVLHQLVDRETAKPGPSSSRSSSSAYLHAFSKILSILTCLGFYRWCTDAHTQVTGKSHDSHGKGRYKVTGRYDLSMFACE